MHILFITDNFPPESNAPASRTFEHAREWVKCGHKVTIITGVPNFPEGKVFEGYKNKLYQKEFIEGIEVRRVKTYIAKNAGFFRRILDFTSFMFSSFWAGLFVKEVDVVVGTSPQFFTVVGAWILSAMKRKPFVFELRDIWPASIKAVGAVNRPMIIDWLEKLELFLYRRADLIITVTNSFKGYLIEHGIDKAKVEVVLNGVDETKFYPAKRKNSYFLDKLKLEGKFIVGYIGTHGLAHALDNVINTAEILKNNTNIHFLFVGSGVKKESLIKLVEDKKLNNVTFIPRQRKEMMPEFWSLCDISLVSLKDDILFESVIPSKIFESMGMGLPIIASIPKGEAAKIIDSSDSGVISSPEDCDALSKEIFKLYSNEELLLAYSENSYSASRSYNRKVQAHKMIYCIEQVVD